MVRVFRSPFVLQEFRAQAQSSSVIASRAVLVPVVRSGLGLDLGELLCRVRAHKRGLAPVFCFRA